MDYETIALEIGFCQQLMITPEQCRMARAALRLSVEQLARTASVSAATISGFETGRTRAQRAVRKRLRAAFEAAGIVFTDFEEVGGRGRALGCAVLAANRAKAAGAPPADRPPDDEPPEPTITPLQCRMARAALRIGIRDLARMAKMSHMTVSRFESGQSAGQDTTRRKLQTALESAGIAFIPENGGGPGVRLRR
jgi:transcriptional regulator with XRE-family HTH domain